MRNDVRKRCYDCWWSDDLTSKYLSKLSHICLLRCYCPFIICSLLNPYSDVLLVFSVLDLTGDDSRVAWLEVSWTLIQILVCWDKLSLIVAASITDNNLRWILIGHHDGWLWQSTSESIWMIRFERLLKHASVKVFPHLKLVLREWRDLRKPLCIHINWLGRSILESQANILTILLKDLAARSYFRILEHCSWRRSLLLELTHCPLQLFCQHVLDFFFLLFLLGQYLFWNCHIV